MKILEYADLDVSKVRSQYRKVISFLEKDDFYSAEVKKLAEHGLYRAKLDDSNRLIFKIVSYNCAQYALILEAVLNHAYDKSKFLRGARIDDSKIPLFDKSKIDKEAVSAVAYINSSVSRFHFLDKIISFDPEQQDAYRHNLPLIIIGPAGSGKTALVLEKMKELHGRILYVTLSPYLADNSRNLYYSHHYENEDQEILFLSFREFLETMRVPQGREIKYNVFVKWLMRFPRQQRVADAHRLYEEFRGVITGSIVDKPYLSREDYMNLGVRQSIYLSDERARAYTLFEKYLAFLKEKGYYDPNILAHHYLSHATSGYDYVVVDEVQDITNIQLQLILKGIKDPANFILCGDSNQIVHPNFFSWSALKTMLYNTASLESDKVIRILHSNFRNSAAVTDLSNKILRIKQKRFGSIDRESNYLMNSLSKNEGGVLFLKDTDKVKRELNQKTRRSAKFAVLVMRDEEKEAVRKFFDTPLLFSIQEAKGLEYENVILPNFISNERSVFNEIINGVNTEDLEGDLKYLRAADKTDKSLEVYKFFVNSLYVAVTRAVQRLYAIEGDTGHPLMRLLGMLNATEQVIVDAKQSSIEEWQAEARKLELQGRQEQADEIRRDILKTQPVPWEVYTPSKVKELINLISEKKDIAQKPKKTLQAFFEYSLFYDDPKMMELLSAQGFDKARQIYFLKQGKSFFNHSLYNQQRTNYAITHLHGYTSSFYQTILKQCVLYGINHRTAFNKTPLMLASMSGNIPLIKELIASGADEGLTDNHGLTAWQSALQRAVYDKKFASEIFPELNEILPPSNIGVKADDRLIKIDGSQGEFLLFNIFVVTLHHRINYLELGRLPLTAVRLAEMVSSLSDSTILPYRKKRAYISALLSKNEHDSTNPYCKKLFKRIKTGYYMLNPGLSMRHKENWMPIYQYLNSEQL